MKMTTMKVSIFTFICVVFSFDISMIRSHVLQNDESKLLSLLTVDNFVQDETCAKMIHDNSSSTDKEYKEYPDAMHQLLVELEDVKSDAHSKILDWMNNRLNKN